MFAPSQWRPPSWRPGPIHDRKRRFEDPHALAFSPSFHGAGTDVTPATELQEHRLSEIAGEEKKGYVPSGDHVYLNILVTGNNTHNLIVADPTLKPTLAKSDITYQSPLLENCSEWTFSVIRLRVPTAYIPLFQYVPGSCVVSIVTGGNTFASNVTPLAVDSLTTDANAIYSIEQFVFAVNSALATAYQQAINGGFGGSPGMGPYISYNAATELMTISFEQTWWSPDGDLGFNAGNTAKLFFNNVLYESFFDSFQGVYTTLGNNLDVNILLYQNTQPPAAAGPQIQCQTGGLTAVGAVCTWTNSPVQHGASVNGGSPQGPGNNVVVISGASPNAYNGVYFVTSTADRFTFTYTAGGAPGVSPAVGSPTMVVIPRGSQIPGQYNSYVQETPCIASWDQFVSLRLVSTAIPVRAEMMPTPNGGSQIGGRQILTDMQRQYTNLSDTRDYLQYIPSAEYRRIDLVSAEALRRVDVQAYWVDKNGVESQVFIPDNDSMDMKFLFEKRRS